MDGWMKQEGTLAVVTRAHDCVCRHRLESTHAVEHMSHCIITSIILGAMAHDLLLQWWQVGSLNYRHNLVLLSKTRETSWEIDRWLWWLLWNTAWRRWTSTAAPACSYRPSCSSSSPTPPTTQITVALYERRTLPPSPNISSGQLPLQTNLFIWRVEVL